MDHHPYFIQKLPYNIKEAFIFHYLFGSMGIIKLSSCSPFFKSHGQIFYIRKGPPSRDP